MSATLKEIEILQAEYSKLEREGLQKYGPKAIMQLEKKLRDETKKLMEREHGNRDAFKARKSEVAKELRAAKDKRRAEIVSAVGDGKLDPAAAQAEIVKLGWEPGVAQADINNALGKTSKHVETLAKPAEPEPVARKEIMDPVSAAEPVARKIEFVEVGKPELPPARK